MEWRVGREREEYVVVMESVRSRSSGRPSEQSSGLGDLTALPLVSEGEEFEYMDSYVQYMITILRSMASPESKSKSKSRSRSIEYAEDAEERVQLLQRGVVYGDRSSISQLKEIHASSKQ